MGKLNPKTSITRAEFAKVISEMASTYADADDSLSCHGGRQRYCA